MEDNWLLKKSNLKLEEILNAIDGENKEIIIVGKDMKIIWANHNFEKQEIGRASCRERV